MTTEFDAFREILAFVLGFLIWVGVVLIILIEFIVFWLRFRGVI